jgi:hypothetical protein
MLDENIEETNKAIDLETLVNINNIAKKSQPRRS